METSTRWWRIGSGTIVVLSILLVGVGGAYIAVANNDLRAQLSASQSNAQSLYEQLLDEGVKPEGEAPAEVVPGPAGDPGERGPRGERGFPGIDGIDGTDGIDGAPGTNGPAGEPGANGEPGVAGEQGAAGPSGATGASGPQGPQGAPGSAGPTGATGVGIAEIACQDDGTWQFTMTDDTVKTIPGPCRVAPTIEGETP